MTFVRFVDPRAITVEIETPHGPETLVPAGNERQEVELPRSSPPYGNRALYPAFAIRDEAGGLSLRCDACLGVPAMHFDAPGGTLALNGPASQFVDFRGDELALRIEYPFYIPGYRGRLYGPYEAFAVRLVTPMSNVIEVRDLRRGHPRDGWWAAAIGAFLVTAGAVLLSTSHEHQPAGRSDAAAVGVGAGSVLGGVALMVWGAVTLAMPSSDTRVEPKGEARSESAITEATEARTAR